MATNGPSVLPTRHLAQLKEPTWNFTGSKAASELNAAKTARDAAQAEQEKLECEPAPLKLPVLNLEVKPVHFFWLAPLLLTTLYWNLALFEHALGRLLRGLREQMRVQSVDQSALALAMPELAREARVYTSEPAYTRRAGQKNGQRSPTRKRPLRRAPPPPARVGRDPPPIIPTPCTAPPDRCHPSPSLDQRV